ncbi:hypothetical protein L249_8137, partial [Ophiocordyceps polyrhachis-furcata BCC 54312]
NYARIASNKEYIRRIAAIKKALLAATNLRYRLNPKFRKDKILFDFIPKVCNIFVDNIPIRSLETIYNNKEALPRI